MYTRDDESFEINCRPFQFVQSHKTAILAAHMTRRTLKRKH